MKIYFNLNGTLELPDDSSITVGLNQTLSVRISDVDLTPCLGFTSEHSGYFSYEELEELKISDITTESFEVSTEDFEMSSQDFSIEESQ